MRLFQYLVDMPYKDKEKQKERNREYQKAHYQKKKDYYKDKAATRKQDMKTFITEYKTKKGCSKCKENHPACLDFHHLSDKEFNVAEAVTRGYSKTRILTEIDKCIILCANCHRKLHCEESAGPPLGLISLTS